MNIRELVERLIADAAFSTVINSPASQFGTEAEPLLGANYLPEQDVEENAYVEEAIRYRSVIANDGTRYSPVQIKEGIMTGQFQVILGNSDIGSDFTGQHYDTLLRIIRRFQPGSAPSMDQLTSLINWVDTTLSMPLRMRNEKQRWDALVHAQILRTGDGGYRETVNYPNPSGHRVSTGGTWSNNSYDPYLDIIAMANFLKGKGFTINAIIAGSPVVSILSNNTNVMSRLGLVTIAAGLVVGRPGIANLEDINKLLARDSLPPITEYNGQYRTQTSSGYYLPRDSMVFLCTTGRDDTVLDVDSRPLLLRNTLGYTAIGRPAGEATPGRALDISSHTNKPPRIHGESWQTTLPVITEPEAIGVISGIA